MTETTVHPITHTGGVRALLHARFGARAEPLTDILQAIVHTPTGVSLAAKLDAVMLLAAYAPETLGEHLEITDAHGRVAAHLCRQPGDAGTLPSQEPRARA
jgi:hypothetical protein